MSRYLIEQIEAIHNIEVRTCTEVVRRHGRRPPGDADAAATPRPARRRPVEAAWLFVFIGAAPRTDWLDGTLARDERGFVLTGPDLTSTAAPAGWDLDRPPYHLETSVPGVFVAGDVRADSVKRVASAVGEGAMAVTLVHRYLERS